MKKVQIQLYRSDKNTEFNSFEELESIVIGNDKGSQYVLDHNLKDGETIIFKYLSKNPITGETLPHNCYGVVYNKKDEQGGYRKISLYKSYDDFYRLNKERPNNIGNIKNGFITSDDFSLTKNDIDARLINIKTFLLQAGNNITLTSNNDNTLYINGEKNTDTKYTASDGLSMKSNGVENTILTLGQSGFNKLGGVKTDRNVTDLSNYEKCPIVNDILYFKQRKGSGCGNDYVDHKLRVKSTGWYRIAESDKTSNNTGIFTIGSGYYVDGITESIFTFIPSYNLTSANKKDVNDELNNFDGVNLTQISCSTKKSYVGNTRPVISTVRICYPENYSTNNIAYIEVYVRVENGETFINLDISNLRGWNIYRGDANHYLSKSPNQGDDMPNGWAQESISFLNSNALRAKSFYQGGNRVIDEHDFATTSKGGIIKLYEDNRISNTDNYYPIELNGNKEAFIKIPKEKDYVLKFSKLNEIGGYKSYNIEDLPRNLSPLVNVNNIGYFKTPIINSFNKTYGVLRTGSTKNNSVNINVSPKGSKIFPVIIDKNNRLCVKFSGGSASEATFTNLGTVKLYSNTIVPNIKIPTTKSKYLPLQVNNSNQAFVKTNPISGKYTLPTATMDELGGVKAYTENSTVSKNLQLGGIYCPVFVDENDFAFVKFSYLKGGSAEGNVPFTYIINSYNDIQNIFSTNKMQNSLGIRDYRKFVFFHKMSSLNLTYYLNQFVNYLPNQPYEVDIYIYQKMINMYNSLQYNVVLNQCNSGGVGANSSIIYDVKYCNLIPSDGIYPTANMNKSRTWNGVYTIDEDNSLHIKIINFNSYTNNGSVWERYSNPTFAVFADKLSF